MTELHPTTVEDAGIAMAPGLGLSWQDNRAKVVDGINLYRNHLFNNYGKNGLFDDVFHCFCPQKFLEPCTGGKCNTYLGATMPANVAGVVTAWSCRRPLKVRSRWREAFTGRISDCEGELSITTMPERYATERDFAGEAYIKVYAASNADHGKDVFITDRRGKKHKFTLDGDAWVESAQPLFGIESVVLPELVGSVTVATETDYELSTYAPWEKVPSYLRIKFNQPCPANVFVQGTRQFTKVWFNEDIVEVGDALVMRYMAEFFRYDTAKDASKRQLAANALQLADANLKGLISRYVAGAMSDKLTKRPRKSNILPGYRKSVSIRPRPQ